MCIGLHSQGMKTYSWNLEILARDLIIGLAPIKRKACAKCVFGDIMEKSIVFLITTTIQLIPFTVVGNFI